MRSGDGRQNLKSVIIKEVKALHTGGGCASAVGRFNSCPSRQGESPFYPFLFLLHGPAEGQPPELRDGFRIIRLVMSIILLLILRWKGSIYP